MLATAAVFTSALVAPDASAATNLSGLVVDSNAYDGFGFGETAHLTTGGYTVTESVTSPFTQFVTHTASGQYAGPAVMVAPPTGQTFTAGQSYPIAATPDATNAAMRFNSTICSASALPTGTISILEATPADPTYSVLAATYHVACGSSAPLYGEIRYNSSVDVTSTSTLQLSVNLGSAPPGATTPAKTINVYNNGTLPTTLGQATLGGADIGDFAVTNDTCSGIQLAAGAGCTLQVTATPEPGLRKATVSLPDGSARGQRIVGLSASGQTAPGAPTAVTTRTASDGVAVSWRSPTDTGQLPITGYDVLRGTTPDNLSVVASNVFSYADRVSDTTATGTTYYYAVRATNAVGTGPASDPVPGTTPDSVVAPASRYAFFVEGGHGSFVTPDASVLAKRDADHPQAANAQMYSNGIMATGDTTPGSPTFTFFPPSSAAWTWAPGSYPFGSDSVHPTGQLCVASHCDTSGTLVINRIDIDAGGALVTLSADVTTYKARASIRYGVTDPLSGAIVGGIDAGPIVAGTPTQATMTYQNVGDTPLTISTVSVVPADSAASTDWVASGTDTCTGATVDAGSSCSVGLSITPSAGGTRNGQVVIADDAPIATHYRPLTAFARTVPTQPGSLTASRAGDGAVTLSWADQPSSGGGQADSYTVSVGTAPDALHELATVPGASQPSYRDPDPTSDVRYYSVTPSNIAGTGPTATLTVDATLHVPSGLAVAPIVSGGIVTWTAPTGYPAGTVTYDVYKGSSASTLTPVATNVTSTTYSLTGLASGATYAVAVRADTVNGDTSAFTPAVSFRPATADLLLADRHSDMANAYGLSRASLTPGAQVDLQLPIPGSNTVDVEDVTASPNGLRVAFDTYNYYWTPNSDNGDIWVVDSTGSNAPLALTTGAADDAEPAWSLDNQKLAFTRFSTATGVGSLYTISASGGSPVAIPNSNYLSSPTWIGPRTLVAEDDSTASASLVRVDTITGVKTPVPNSTAGSLPVASPAANEVAYTTQNANNTDSLYVVTLAGVRRAIALPANPGPISSISWSRDLHTLYVVLPVNGHNQVLATSAAGGGTPTPVTNLATDPISATVVAPDNTAPSLSVGKLPAFTLTGALKLTFAGADGSGIRNYNVRYTRSTATTAATTVTAATGTTATSYAMKVTPGTKYCFSVQATDRAGNVSQWSNPTCTIAPLDDRALRRSAGFAAATGSAYYLGTVASTKTFGQTLSTTLTVQPVDLVATTCPTCGTVEIRKGTTVIGTVSLHSTTTTNRGIIALPTKTAAGAVSIRVISSGRPVLIDGLVLKPQ